MKNVKKLKLEQFDRFALLTNHLKNLTGGGTPTSRSGMKDGTNGADWIDECGDQTHFSDGSSSGDSIPR